MKRITATLFICIISFYAKSQSVVAFSSGIATDLNNEKPFYTIPLTLHWEPFRRSAFFIEATKGIGLNRLSKVDAYTTNEQLPEHVNITEVIKFQSFSVAMGGAIKLYTNSKNNRLSLNLSAGIIGENFSIVFKNYDKANYEVLNPDVSENLAGLYCSGAVVYNFHKRKRDMFLKLRIQSPSTAEMPDNYNLSYNNTAAFSLMYGYKLFYNKN
jgi:hypothetical protein